MRKKLLLGIMMLLTVVSFAQTTSFPANKTYSSGLMPGNKSGQDAANAYNIWKTNFATACSNGRYRVKWDDPSMTVSEGIGYGMLLSAYAGDKTLFDGFWLYYKDFRNSHGVMNWKISGCNSVAGQNGATDSEVDAAMALIVAHYQWGSNGTINYQNDGKSLIAAIKSWEVESGSNVLKPGDMFGGSNITNPSYYAPGYFRAYGQFTNDAAYWNGVADKCLQIINNNLTVNNAAGGLVSDWCKADGNYSGDASGYFDGGKRYHYDAARTPWRIAVDYVWNGTANAKTYIKKSSEFVRVNLGGPKNIKDGYYQNGSAYGQWHNSTFAGPFACAAMGGDNQTHLNSSYSDLVAINDNNSYFNHSLKTLTLFLLTGNFYLPGSTTTNNISPTVSISSPANNSSFTAGATITINANASDSDGSISKVEFFSGATKLGEDLTSPYSFTWSNVSAGSYTLTAKATDNAGAVTTSSQVAVTVNSVVVQSPYNGVVNTIPGKIEAEQYDLGGQGVAYNDVSATNEGGAFRTDGVDIEATSDLGGGFNVGWISAGEWLEYSVNVTTAGAYSLQARVASTTAGKTFHIEMDGQNISGVITVPNTGGWQNWQTVTITTSSLTTGQKIMRVAMDSPDFNLNSVTFAALTTNNNAPSVALTAPVNGSSYTEGTAITITANASDSDGSVGKVEFFAGATKIGEDLNAPYNISWTAASSGTYTITAKATDDKAAVTTSAGVTITISTATNNAPSVVLTAPANGSGYTAGSAITITANASDSDGSVSKVEFYAGATKIGEDLSAPYNISWTAASSGTYTLTAKATDDKAAVATSAGVTITISVSNNTGCNTTALPNATTWVVRNDWADQNNGSATSNTTEAMKVTHRQWGDNYLWIIQNITSFSSATGTEYTISFDYKDDPSLVLASMELGLASGDNWNGPILTQPSVVVPSGWNASSYTTKTIKITASTSGNVRLAIKLNWSSQVNSQVNSLIKNISICGSNIAGKMGTMASPIVGSSIYPNPFTDFTSIKIEDDENLPVTISVSDLAGITLFESAGYTTNQTIEFGSQLTSGVYIIQAKFGGKTSVSKLIKY